MPTERISAEEYQRRNQRNKGWRLDADGKLKLIDIGRVKPTKPKPVKPKPDSSLRDSFSAGVWRIAMRCMGKARPRVRRDGRTYMPPTYVAWKDEFAIRVNRLEKFKADGKAALSIRIFCAMPKSWSQKKRFEMLGKPRLSTPDLDNCIGAIQDALLENDSEVWRYKDAYKVWGDSDLIVIEVVE